MTKLRRPSDVRPSSTIPRIFSSETAWLIKAKLRVEDPWEGRTPVYINGLCHMTKMVAMAMQSKNILKIFFSRIRGPMILKLGTNHRGIKLYRFYINDDPWLT